MAAVKALEIIHPGPLTTIQDRGRFGYGRFGVPPGGALDAFSLRTGNLLVGNAEDEAGLEITLMGLKVRALKDLVFALTGADLQPRLNDQPLENWRSHAMRKGDTLALKGPRTGCRAYLAVGGGLKVPRILGSKSTNLSTGFGGLCGRPLRKGDVLLCHSPEDYLHHHGRTLDPQWIPVYERDWHLRVILGPQEDHFAREARKAFFGPSFKVKPESDRTGIRLGGPEIVKRPDLGESIISEGVVPGTVQIPGDGQPIIILVETVTGGYRKIATVISADLSFLGQIKPGDRVRFQAVTLDQAYDVLRKQESLIRRFKDSLCPIP